MLQLRTPENDANLPEKAANAAPAGLPPMPEAVEERIDLVRAWLIAGKTPSDIHAVLQAASGVSKRTAQYYVARARAIIAGEAEEESLSFSFGRSQQLRDRLLERLLRVLDAGNLDPHQVRSVVAVVKAACGLLGERDSRGNDYFDRLNTERQSLRRSTLDIEIERLALLAEEKVPALTEERQNTFSVACNPPAVAEPNLSAQRLAGSADRS